MRNNTAPRPKSRTLNMVIHEVQYDQRCAGHNNQEIQTRYKRWGFPLLEGQSTSYWLWQARYDPLLHHGSRKALSSSADCVIIGSGVRYLEHPRCHLASRIPWDLLLTPFQMSGCLIAKHYKEKWPSRSVVILESREFCSGATGRNAGHCKPASFKGFARYEKQFGTEQAIKILQNEQDTLRALVAYVKENNVDCDLWVGDTFDVPLTPETAAQASASFERFKAAGANIDDIKVTSDPRSASRLTRLKSAQACYAGPAATLHPFKLTAHIMHANLSSGIGLHTHTTVRSVIEQGTISTSKDANEHRWNVLTDRGDILCHTVIHASNAYVGAYEPLFRDVIIPGPHMCDKVNPPASFSGSKALQNSYTVLLPDPESRLLFSINPRSTSDGTLLFGGQNPGQAKLDEWIDAHPVRCVNDGLVDVEMVTEEVRAFTRSELTGWNVGGKTDPDQGCEYSWSGILGMSPDRVPFVGEIPGKKGQWACVAHSGTGMTRIFTAAPGLVKLMSGEHWKDTGLPEAFELTMRRIGGLRRGRGE